MKTKKDLIVLILCLAVLPGVVKMAVLGPPAPVQAEPIDTYHTGWSAIKAPGAEDGASFGAVYDLDANGGDFASMGSDAFRIAARGGGPGAPYSQGAAWMFAFCGTDAPNETFSFNLIGWARDNGMAQVLCEGDGVLGTQDVVIYPGGSAATNAFWADTLNLDELTKWPEIGRYNYGGDNEVALLLVDMAGIEYIDFVFYDAAGGAECSTIGVYGRRY